MAVVMLVGLAVSSSSRAYPIVAGRDLGPELTPLEAKVSKNPEDAQALQALVDAYLQRGASGLAEAAISRAPSEVRQKPTIAHARARALAELGHASVALQVQEGVLASCAKPAARCSQTLVGRAYHRVAWLQQMVKLGVDDPSRQPERALLAYRLSTREVRLDVH